MSLEPIADRRRRQRKEALAVANKVRIAKAELKKRLRAGEIPPVPLLRGDVEMWSRFAWFIQLDKLLQAIPGIGKVTAYSIIREASLYPDDRLQRLTEEERERLVRLVALVLDQHVDW